MILLQEAIAAGFFLLYTIVILLIVGFTGSWIYFSYAEKKHKQKNTSSNHYFFRFSKSIGLAIILVLVFILLLLLWNPTLD